MRVGIDFGGHTLTAARIAMGKGGALPSIDRLVERRTPDGRRVADIISAMAEMTSELAENQRIEGVGVAIPGMLDSARRYSPRMANFPEEWDGLDIPDALSKALASRELYIPVKIENDANCYALGEGAAGAAVGLADYVVFTMGTGIGCGIVLGGRILTGAHGMAAEGGHIVVDGGAPCGCGGMGHAETLAATDGTVKRARAAGILGEFKEIWAMRGDQAADMVLGVTIDGMGRAVATITHLLDPEAIIIGGGMSRAQGICGAICEAAMPYLARPYRSILDLRVSKLGNDAALYGAASV
ncbi:MAG: ROK family protein [Synergistaceae bacterium]|jgi:glucokinase|nr:ROK family protein [Synergistaceae bacterium]